MGAYPGHYGIILATTKQRTFRLSFAQLIACSAVCAKLLRCMCVLLHMPRTDAIHTLASTYMDALVPVFYTGLFLGWGEP